MRPHILGTAVQALSHEFIADHEEHALVRCPSLKELPPPPAGKSGWPWTEESPPVPLQTDAGEEWPRISIVTPSFNHGRFIEETIRSVLLQGYPNLEYLVVDGGSTDESAEIIRRYEPWLAYWCSERDRGQSDAINKGFGRSTGEVLGWLNSDDLLEPGALHRIGQTHVKHPDAVVAGEVTEFRDGTGEIVRTARQEDMRWERFVNFWQVQADWHQPGLFYPRHAWNDCGPLDDSLYYCMDRDLLARALRYFPVAHVDGILARFRLHASNKTVVYDQTAYFEEKVRVFMRYVAHLEGDARSGAALFMIRLSRRYARRGKIGVALQVLITALRILAGRKP